MKIYKYYVWIGGVANIFDNMLDAEIEKIKWNEKGYNDVKIEINER
jgi:hypothetical protein